MLTFWGDCDITSGFASPGCTNRRVKCILNRIGGAGGGWGVCQLVCQATAMAQFHAHVILQLLKIKSCTENKDINMGILLLANWQNYLKR